MTITKTENGDTTIIAVEGRLNTSTANEFGNEVKNLLETVENLVFDFEKVEYISSTGLRVLLFAQKEMNKRGTMKIINVSDEVYDVMQDVGFTGISEIYKKE
ncbi:MAG: STAS domain-containing protein [Clostridia bacterium]|nr:STAS domain-containing protein [Clostridia bacterium]